MPVQIPSLNRLAPQAPTSVGRVEAPSLDASRSLGQTTKALTGLGAQVIGHLEQGEKNAISSQKKVSVSDYDTFWTTKMYGDPKTKTPGLIHSTSNPAEIYSKFYEEADAKLNELSGVNGSLSENAQAEVKRALDNRHAILYNQSLTTYGKQQDKYDQNLTNSTFAMESRTAVNAVGLINPSDSTTIQPFDDALDRIIQNRVDRGLGRGSIQEVSQDFKAKQGEKVIDVQNPDGSTTRLRLNDSAANDIAQDLSDTIFKSINLLANSTTPNMELADFMLERYSNRIDPVNKAKLNKIMGEGRVKSKALQVVASTRGMGATKALAKIDGVKDLEVRSKALSIKNSQDRARAETVKRYQDGVAETLFKRVSNIQSSGAPYTSVEELLNDDVYLVNKENIRASQDKVLREMIERPAKISKRGAKLKAYEAHQNGQLEGMGPLKLGELLIGLNQRDANEITSLWKRQNNPASPAQQRAAQKEAYNEVLDAAKRAKILPVVKDDRKDIHTERELILQDLITKRFDQIPVRPGPELKKFANQIVVDFIGANSPEEGFLGLFGGEEFLTPEGFDTTPAAPTTPIQPGDIERTNLPDQTGADKKFRDLSPQEKTRMIKLFRDQNPGSKIPTAVELDKFVKENI